MYAQTRPRELASPFDDLNGQSMDAVGGNEYLVFRLGGQEYALDIIDVQDIRNYSAPTRVSGAPAYMAGVLNLRGSVVPVIDMRLRMNLPATFDVYTATVVINLPSGRIGLVVDGVSEMLELRAEEIQPMPGLNDSTDSRLFESVGCLRDGDKKRMLIILNLRSLMYRHPGQSVRPL